MSFSSFQKGTLFYIIYFSLIRFFESLYLLSDVLSQFWESYTCSGWVRLSSPHSAGPGQVAGFHPTPTHKATNKGDQELASASKIIIQVVAPS